MSSDRQKQCAQAGRHPDNAVCGSCNPDRYDTGRTADEYNGWTNRETWAVALYVNNDQGWQEQVHALLTEARDWANEHADAKPGQVERFDAQQAGEVIREHFEEIVGNATDSPAEYLTRDLFMALMDIGSLYRVDWDELGANFLSALDES